MKGVIFMQRKEVFNLILLSLSLAYVVTKTIANFDSIDAIDIINVHNSNDTDSS